MKNFIPFLDSRKRPIQILFILFFGALIFLNGYRRFKVRLFMEPYSEFVQKERGYGDCGGASFTFTSDLVKSGLIIPKLPRFRALDNDSRTETLIPEFYTQEVTPDPHSAILSVIHDEDLLSIPIKAKYQQNQVWLTDSVVSYDSLDQIVVDYKSRYRGPATIQINSQYFDRFTTTKNSSYYRFREKDKLYKLSTQESKIVITGKTPSSVTLYVTRLKELGTIVVQKNRCMFIKDIP